MWRMTMSVDPDRYQKVQTWLAIYDMYQSYELNEKVEKLNTQLTSQFDKSNKLQQSALDQLEKQKEKAETENNFRELLFEFSIEANKIEKFSKNLEKFIAAESLTKKLQLENIESKFLSTIADKEYHYNLIERLKYISNSALKNLSDTESNDLENLKNTKNDFTTLTNEFKNDKELLEKQIEELENVLSTLRNKKRKYEPSMFFKTGVLWAFILGMGASIFLVMADKELGSDHPAVLVPFFVMLACLFGWFPISLLIIIWAKIINSFDRKDDSYNTLKAIDKADKELYSSKTKLGKIIENFNKKSQLLKEKISSISSKYPSLNFEWI
jgi:DNA repair exonuclease SbcCD ATPase subunit